jgi:hypothetical protein
MVIPATVLLPFRNSALAQAFCGTTLNLSYDGMLIAAGFGIGLAHLVLSLKTSVVFESRAGNALDVFDITVMAALTFLYASVGIVGSALVWGIGLLTTALLVFKQAKAERMLPRLRGVPRTPADWVASGLLLALAIVFILFPVSKPWSGPVEPFVRWHPFSPEIESIWRGIFGSFAIAMAVAAFDPGMRHRPFLLALGLSGMFHALFMGADNLLAAQAGTANGNPEHLYGDVAGWFAIGVASIAYWWLRRPRPLQHTTNKATRSL